MKQLKFMLAAATALGLATASQATDYGSNNFEDDVTLPYAFPNETAFPLWSAGTGNASEIVADNSNAGLDAKKYTKKYPKTETHAQALSVDTTDTPLLRNFAPGGLPVLGTVFIDTMVQFTRTQEGQEPDLDNLDEENKLMLYAKTNTVGETKLFVVASQYSFSDFDGESKTPVSKETNAEVSTNNWYRLTVMTTVKELVAPAEGVDGKYINVFKVYLDGSPVRLEDDVVLFGNGGYPEGSDEGYFEFPSIQGATATAGVTAVGFAGQGMVDDLVVTTEDPIDVGSLDFTFTWSGDGITGVSYTIGEATTSVTSGEPFYVDPNSSFKVNVTLADWYKLAAGTTLEYNNVTAGDKVTLTAELMTSASDLGVTMTIPEGTTATEADILAWAKAANATTDDVKGAANIVANYLLNVPDLEVEPKIEIVDVKPATDTTPMTITAKVTDAKGTVLKDLTATGDNKINATIKYKAAPTLEAFKTATPKETIDNGDKFVQVVVE